jgi:serine/threonine-protein kinase
MADMLSRLTSALADRYRLQHELGAGGMATVYLAEDLKHRRQVAIKVMRPELAAVIGAERFLAEITTTANLQHPHILPLHDSGAVEGTVFYVMPFIEGESLRDRLDREKQLSIGDAVRITREVAGALDYAHRHGVIHRDIKPENILLHDGRALVADFGIALAASKAEGSTRMTETGMSLGTPHYMSPEQAMGARTLDARTDVYALGCVLYEMLTGEPPFNGPSAQAIVARAVTEQPRPITIHRHTVPLHVEATTLKALEKLPADRFATAAEFAAALEKPELTVGATRAAAGSAPARREWRARAAVPLAAVSTLSLAALGWALLRPAAPELLTRYPLYFPDEAAPLPDRPVVISPDGSHLAYVGPADNGATQVWLKARDQEYGRPIPGTVGANSFTFSPDSRWLAFVQTNQIRKWPLTGGAAITLVDSSASLRGLAWLDDGTIVYPRQSLPDLMRVPEAGGASTVVWSPDSSTQFATSYFPTPLQGGRGVLFGLCYDACLSGYELHALDLASGRSAMVAADGIRGVHTLDGHVLFARRDGVLLAAPFDLKTLAFRKAPVPVLDSVSIGPNGPIFSLSDEGTLLTRTGGVISSLGAYEFVWVDRQGVERSIDSSFTFRQPVFGANAGWALSPDGRRVALGQATPAGDNVWVKELPNGPVSRVTIDTSPAFRPRWSRDGRYVIYHAWRLNNTKLFRRAADGTGGEELLYEIPQDDIWEAAWTLDGKTLALRAGGQLAAVGGRDIMVVRPGVDSAPRPLIATPKFDESGIALSPDGNWIAYESNETGRTEVYIRPFPAVESGRWPVSVDGGRAPLWNRNGRELFYVNGARVMVAVPLALAGGAPRIGTREALFPVKQYLYLADQENYTPFDVTPDGQRFLMARRVNALAARSEPLVVTEHWTAELRRIVATQ